MKMKNMLMTTLLSGLMSLDTQASDVQWSSQYEPQAIEKTRVEMNQAAVRGSTDQEAMSYTQPLPSNQSIVFENSGHTESSRHYYLDTTAAKLAQGFPLQLTNGEAVVRVSPLSRVKTPAHNELNSLVKNRSISPDMVKLTQNGQPVQTETFATHEELKAAGMDMVESTFALKVNATKGPLRLKIDDLGNSEERFVVNVQEKLSDYVLDLVTETTTYPANSELAFKVALLAHGEPQEASLAGYISNPNGEKVAELRFTLDDTGYYTGRASVGKGHPLTKGLWEVNVVAEAQINGLKIIRDNNNAFAVNVNTATFNGNLELKTEGLYMGLTVAEAGRYSVRGVMLGMTESGDQKPMLFVDTANWLKEGEQTILLPVDHQVIKQSGLNPPYQIKGLELMNMTYLAPVQSVVDGVIINTLKSN